MKFTPIVLKIAILFVSVLLFHGGCKKDELEPVIKDTENVSGHLIKNEIGGENLNIQSVFKQDCPIENGAFTTDVSTKGTQILFITDENEEIRGLSLSTISNETPSVMEVGALSTAYSLLFLTNGITVLDPDTTQVVINKLVNLHSFSSLVEYLKSNLKSSTLPEIISHEEAVSLLMNCVFEYKGLDTVPDYPKKSTEIDYPDPYFEVQKLNSTQVQLKNTNWRRVNIYRRDFKQDGSKIGEDKAISVCMRGGTPLSWGSLITGTLYQPTVDIDNTYAHIDTEIAYCEYWVTGPSNGDCYYPPGIPQDITQQTISTVLDYHVYAIIQLICGASAFTSATPGQTMEYTVQAAKELSAIPLILVNATKVTSAHNYQAQFHAWMNLFLATWVPAVNYLSIHGAITGSAAPILIEAAKVIGFITLVFNASNIVVTTVKCYESPIISKYIIFTDNNVKPILLTPANGTLVSSLTPSLTCQPYYLGASNYKFQVSTSADFIDLIIDANSKSSLMRIQNGTLHPETKYYWRVRVTTLSGSDTEWSDIWLFTTGSIAMGLPCPGLEQFEYGGQVYHTVQIGDQCWMKENLNVGTKINSTSGGYQQQNNGIIEKYCYDNNEENCAIYGGLYEWPEAMQYMTIEVTQGICPDGWHIPTDGDWHILSNYLGGASIAGGKVKSIGTIEDGTGLWLAPNTGATNSSGFTGLPGGYRGYDDGYFSRLGSRGCFWSSYFWASSKFDTAAPWHRYLTYNDAGMYMWVSYDNNGFSVRCIKDD